MAYLGSLGPGTYADAATIAQAAGAPPNYLGKLLRTLSRSGLLDARKGARGGFRLMRKPEAITLFEILDPIEELVSEGDCILGQGHCGGERRCALHLQWSPLREGILGFLNSTRLDSLVASGLGPGLRQDL
jgi:Rrf2 family protein